MRLFFVVLLAGCSTSLLGLPSKDAMATYVAEHHAKGPQHFCVVKYDTRAIVFWKEGRRFVLWEGSRDSKSLVLSRRDLSLDKDVVATEADIGGSTYLVTRAWVEDKQRDCASFGTRYTIEVR